MSELPKWPEAGVHYTAAPAMMIAYWESRARYAIGVVQSMKDTLDYESEDDGEDDGIDNDQLIVTAAEMAEECLTAIGPLPNSTSPDAPPIERTSR